LVPSLTDRSSFALTTKSGHTRIYVGDGSVGPPSAAQPTVNYSQVWRNDNMNQPASSLVVGGTNSTTGGWKKLTTTTNGTPGYATYNFCTGQCWYDNEILTPAGQPDTVFVIGSYQYTEYGFRSHGRTATGRSPTSPMTPPRRRPRTASILTSTPWSSSRGIPMSGSKALTVA